MSFHERAHTVAVFEEGLQSPTQSPTQSQTQSKPFMTASSSQASLLSSRRPIPEPDSEYLKIVLLKFFESKDKRLQLLPVLGTLLKFTPEELDRVKKKV